MLEILRQLNVITKTNQINKKAIQLLNNHPNVLKQLLDTTSFLHEDETIRARVYCVQEGITSPPLCKVCNKKLRFLPSKRRFSEYCPNTKGSSCASKDKKLQESIKHTILEQAQRH